MCNRLLVPEADEDVHWTDRRTISGRSVHDGKNTLGGLGGCVMVYV